MLRCGYESLYLFRYILRIVKQRTDQKPINAVALKYMVQLSAARGIIKLKYKHKIETMRQKDLKKRFKKDSKRFTVREIGVNFSKVLCFLFLRCSLDYEGRVNSMTFVILFQIVLIVSQLTLLCYSVYILIEKYQYQQQLIESPLYKQWLLLSS